MMAVVITYATKPYMPRRWAARRRAVQNSDEVSTSDSAVCTASEAISPPASCREPLEADLRQFSKKYRALPLWYTSYSVPATTRITIRIT